MLGEFVSRTSEKLQLSRKSSLALKLYQSEHKIPESSSDVIDYVENVVLTGLSDEQKQQFLIWR